MQILDPETAARSLCGNVLGGCAEVSGLEVEMKQASLTETALLRMGRWSRARATRTPPDHLPKDDVREREGNRA